jgi:hypothetical protein
VCGNWQWKRDSGALSLARYFGVSFCRRPKAVASAASSQPNIVQVGNPGGGRPLGARSKLSEVALAALGRDFSQHDEAVIAEVRKTKPATYLALVVSLLPKEVKLQHHSVLQDLTDAELDLIEQVLKANRAQLVQSIEAHAGNGSATELEPGGYIAINAQNGHPPLLRR